MFWYEENMGHTGVSGVNTEAGEHAKAEALKRR